MSYLGTKEDGMYTIAKGENTFIKYYEKNWNDFISEVYYKTELLSYGHKFRPRLVYWGYCAGKSYKDISETDYNAISRVAISIELVHKASTLLDDYIDGDTARHGMEAFHITYGPERTMIYSLNILCKALSNIHDIFINYIDDSMYSKVGMKFVIKTLEDMTLGVLKELDLTENIFMQKINQVKEIMYLETATLITNSLLAGYMLSQNIDTQTIDLFSEIGKDLGYVYQILNDLEPFCSERNNDHKGSINTDISRNRKNISIPIINTFLNTEEKNKLEVLSNTDRDQMLITLFEKYNVKEQLFEEISISCNRIHQNIDLIPISIHNKQWCEDFHNFVDSSILVNKNRLI